MSSLSIGRFSFSGGSGPEPIPGNGPTVPPNGPTNPNPTPASWQLGDGVDPTFAQRTTVVCPAGTSPVWIIVGQETIIDCLPPVAPKPEPQPKPQPPKKPHPDTILD